ncbi:kxDL motif-containing protein CG10681 isoform X2 [Phymastichus coffea]|nr:kxDL motif-containing protein CG10681 isoform X2 [Phymastichus coffea]
MMASGTHGTPESEACSFECFQNYTAPEVFIQGLAGIVDQQDVESMIRAQKQMLQRFEKTNEMLTNCNQLSVTRLKAAGTEFKKHTALLVEMKKDLDYIFKKIRLLKTKLSQQYPQAYNEAVRSSLAEEVVEDGESPSKPAVLEESLESQTNTVTNENLDSNAPKEEVQFAKICDKGTRRKDSSSTDSENDQAKQDSSPYSSDTN